MKKKTNLRAEKKERERELLFYFVKIECYFKIYRVIIVMFMYMISVH